MMTVAEDSPPTTESDLLEMARKGDREAFGELISRHQRRIWMICRQYLDPEEAENAAQESFIKAYTRLGSFNQRSSFSTWLSRIAINQCLDSIRKRKRRPIQEDEVFDRNLEDTSPDPEEFSRRREAVEKILDALNRLPDGQQKIFRLRFFAEMELAEIARALGLHVGTVKTQLFRATHRLRREMEAIG